MATAGGAVHYSVVAGPLGISPWTAYDLLRELERGGLVSASYGHAPGVAVGRTRVAFLPTRAGYTVLGAPAAYPEERALRRARGAFAQLGPVAAARQLAARGPRLDLAAHLGFWLEQADSLGDRTRDGLRQLVGGAPEAASALSAFVAGVYGAVSPRAVGDAGDALTAGLLAFQARLARTTSGRRERLARSVATLLDTLPPPGAAPLAERA